MYGAKILKDSISPAGVRLITWELTYPRFVHAELMTHRVFARNSASSRAVPTKKMLERIKNDPVLPKWWGKNQSGMQANEELSADDIELTKREWLELRDITMSYVERWLERGLHKQIANRPLETWMFITVIVTATEWDNWYGQRTATDAQPELRWVAREMYDIQHEHVPTLVDYGKWHTPLLDDDEIATLESCRFSQDELNNISVGRCGRVSYLTHEGKRDLAEDIKLANEKMRPFGHMSPFEHVATPFNNPYEDNWSGPFYGWMQYRKRIPGESVHTGKPRGHRIIPT